MSNVYSLENLRADLDKQFAPVEVMVGRSKVTLRNLMRLGKEDRISVQDLIDKLQSGDENQSADDMFDLIRSVLLVVVADDKGQTLVDAIGDDLALGMHLMERWTAATQPGEAQNSPS